MLVLRALAVSVLRVAPAALVMVAPALAQPSVETLTVKAYRLTHQPAREALTLIEPLLSARGSVELRVPANTLVLRDHPSAILRIEALLREFDHPPTELVVEIDLLRASPASPEEDVLEHLRGLPPDLVETLKPLPMTRYVSYRLLAGIDIRSKEGEEVSYELGDRYEVRFRIGTVLLEQRLRLRDFTILERLGELDRTLFNSSTVNLILGKALVLGVAGSDLAVALSCDPPGEPRQEATAVGLGAP